MTLLAIFYIYFLIFHYSNDFDINNNNNYYHYYIDSCTTTSNNNNQSYE